MLDRMVIHDIVNGQSSYKLKTLHVLPKEEIVVHIAIVRAHTSAFWQAELTEPQAAGYTFWR